MGGKRPITVKAKHERAKTSKKRGRAKTSKKQGRAKTSKKRGGGLYLLGL